MLGVLTTHKRGDQVDAFSLFLGGFIAPSLRKFVDIYLVQTSTLTLYFEACR